MDDIRTALKDFYDEDRLIRPARGARSGNGLLYLGEVLVMLRKFYIITLDDRLSATASLFDCEVEGTHGLYRRCSRGLWPWTDLEQQDDYIGIGAVSWAIGSPEIADEILEYGRSTKSRIWPWLAWPRLNWIMNNALPGTLLDENGDRSFRPWLGRYPAMVAHLEFAANLRPPLWRKIWWAFTVMFSGSGDENMDPWKLSYLMVQVMDGRSILCELAAKIFWIRLALLQGSMHVVYAKYFSKAPEHPLAKYCRD